MLASTQESVLRGVSLRNQQTLALPQALFQEVPMTHSRNHLFGALTLFAPILLALICCAQARSADPLEKASSWCGRQDFPTNVDQWQSIARGHRFQIAVKGSGFAAFLERGGVAIVGSEKSLIKTDDFIPIEGKSYLVGLVEQVGDRGHVLYNAVLTISEGPLKGLQVDLASKEAHFAGNRKYYRIIELPEGQMVPPGDLQADLVFIKAK